MDDLQTLEMTYNDLGTAVYTLAFAMHQEHSGAMGACDEEVCRKSREAMAAFRRLSDHMKSFFGNNNV